MIAAAGVRIHLAMGATDMRKGFDGLGALSMLLEGAAVRHERS
jgi:hypothetical protein